MTFPILGLGLPSAVNGGLFARHQAGKFPMTLIINNHDVEQVLTMEMTSSSSYQFAISEARTARGDPGLILLLLSAVA
jgi:hypothetical protein